MRGELSLELLSRPLRRLPISGRESGVSIRVGIPGAARVADKVKPCVSRAFVDAEGGTRTPDTRIMIPRRPVRPSPFQSPNRRWIAVSGRGHFRLSRPGSGRLRYHASEAAL